MNDLDERVRLQEDLLAKENEKLGFGRTVYYNISLIENDLMEGQALALRAKAEHEAERANYYRVIGTLLDQRGIETGPR